MPRRHRQKGNPKMNRQISRVVNRVLNKQSETKSISTNLTELTLSSASLVHIQTLNNIVQGDNVNERIGNQCKGFGALVRVIFTNTTTLNQYVRLVVLSAPKDLFDATTDLFLWTGGGSAALAASTINNIYFSLNKNEFNVHYDKVVKLAGSAAVEGGEIKIIKKFIKFNHKLQFPSGTTGDAKDHNMRLLIIPVDASADAATTLELSYETRYYYKDF